MLAEATLGAVAEEAEATLAEVAVATSNRDRLRRGACTALDQIRQPEVSYPCLPSLCTCHKIVYGS